MFNINFNLKMFYEEQRLFNGIYVFCLYRLDKVDIIVVWLYVLFLCNFEFYVYLEKGSIDGFVYQCF